MRYLTSFRHNFRVLEYRYKNTRKKNKFVQNERRDMITTYTLKLKYKKKMKNHSQK